MTDATELPDDIDPELWFSSDREPCLRWVEDSGWGGGAIDYLYVSRWHTWPGRMAAYCPHDPLHPDYRISKSELDFSPLGMSKATRYFVLGFLEGNCPDPDFDYWEASSTAQREWDRRTSEFIETGYWDPSPDHLE